MARTEMTESYPYDSAHKHEKRSSLPCQLTQTVDCDN